MRIRFTIPLLLLLSLAAPGVASAQVEVIQQIRFVSTNPADYPGGRQPSPLTFGYGSAYTDSVDFEQGEQPLPPFVPPDGLFAAFLIPDEVNPGSRDFAYKDVRGVPDSVEGAGGANSFSLVWDIVVRAGIERPIISTSGPLARGIDSILVESTQAGANFRHLFRPEGGEAQLTFREINNLRLTAWFDHNRASAVPFASAGTTSHLSAWPNPARAGESVHIVRDHEGDAELSLVDLRGVELRRERIADAEVRIPTNGLAPGLYIARITGPRGDRRLVRIVVTD